MTPYLGGVKEAASEDEEDDNWGRFKQARD